MRFTSVLILCLPLVLTGCSLTSTTAPTSEISVSGDAIHGIVHGGQQPIKGAHVYLYAAGTGGYGTASTSLLTSSVSTHNPGYYGQAAAATTTSSQTPTAASASAATTPAPLALGSTSTRLAATPAAAQTPRLG